MKRVVLLPTIRKETDKDYTLRAAERFRMHGAEVRFDEAFAGEAFTADAVLCRREELFADIDLIVVLGGDGSILRAAEYALMCNVPLLGINFGRVGYMAELEKHEIPLIDRIYSGDYTIQNRMTMQAEKKTPEDTVLLSDSVLNEVAVGRGAYPKCIDLRLYADDCMCATFARMGWYSPRRPVRLRTPWLRAAVWWTRRWNASASRRSARFRVMRARLSSPARLCWNLPTWTTARRMSM